MRMLEIQKNVNLRDYSTLCVGGPAEEFVVCRTSDEIAEALVYAREKKKKVHLLGGGSNTIFLDGGFAGLVIRILNRGIEIVEERVAGENSLLFRVNAGEPFDDFVRLTTERGLFGLEPLSGIPGDVGAAPIQNIGAYGREVKDLIEKIVCLDRESLEEVEFGAADCRFSYRSSAFKKELRDRFVILQVVFRLRKNGEPLLRYPELRRKVEEEFSSNNQIRSSAIRSAVLALRKKKSMVIDPADPDSRSVGSFFLNPSLSQPELNDFYQRLDRSGIDRNRIGVFEVDDGFRVSAASLVEAAGFDRGYERNGAAISKSHALALVNRNCGSDEILSLASLIETEVMGRFNIHLQREPVVVGESSSDFTIV